MASAVDICNLALSHLGDNATVATLDPPEGSTQAQHCAIFYPMACNSLLEMHDWGFATVREQPALKHSGVLGWRHAYARPANAVRITSVKPLNACRDETQPSVPFLCESDATGAGIILCDHDTVVVKYVARITDTNRFPPLFIVALSWYLASMLAGPIIKGDAGAAEGKRCAGFAQSFINQAAISDANQSHTVQSHEVAWMKRG